MESWRRMKERCVAHRSSGRLRGRGRWMAEEGRRCGRRVVEGRGGGGGGGRWFVEARKSKTVVRLPRAWMCGCGLAWMGGCTRRAVSGVGDKLLHIARGARSSPFWPATLQGLAGPREGVVHGSQGSVDRGHALASSRLPRRSCRLPSTPPSKHPRQVKYACPHPSSLPSPSPLLLLHAA